MRAKTWLNNLNERYPSFYFVLKFLLLFLLLKYSFIFYVGIMSPGGQLYAPFLHKYGDFFTWWASALAKLVQIILMPFYSIVQKGPTLNITNGGGVNIGWACLGVQVLNFWLAFIIANGGTIKYKFKWIAIGVLSITLLNIIRIALIAIASHHKWVFFLSLEPHTTFNIASYICIFILMIIYYKSGKKVPEKNQRYPAQISLLSR